MSERRGGGVKSSAWPSAAAMCNPTPIKGDDDAGRGGGREVNRRLKLHHGDWRGGMGGCSAAAIKQHRSTQPEGHSGGAAFDR